MEIFYSNHSKKRASLRCISHEEVVECLKNGICFHSEQDEEAYTCRYKTTKLVFRVDMEQELIVIITVLNTKEIEKEATKLAKRNKISMRQALKTIKGVA